MLEHYLGMTSVELMEPQQIQAFGQAFVEDEHTYFLAEQLALVALGKQVFQSYARSLPFAIPSFIDFALEDTGEIISPETEYFLIKAATEVYLAGLSHDTSLRSDDCRTNLLDELRQFTFSTEGLTLRKTKYLYARVLADLPEHSTQRELDLAFTHAYDAGAFFQRFGYASQTQESISFANDLLRYEFPVLTGVKKKLKKRLKQISR